MTGDLYDVTDPKVEAFLHTDILDEVIGLFPSKIVHIGGDEANYVHWKNSPEIMAFMKENGLPTCTDLQVWAINRMSKYLASKGCRMIGWNEITGETVREGIQASQSEQLAPGTIVQFWDGDVSLVNKAIAKGYDVVNSNRFFTYVDYAYEVTPFEKAYSFDPIPEGLAEKDKRKSSASDARCGESTPRPSSGSTPDLSPNRRLRRKRLDRSGEKVVPRLPQALEKDRGDLERKGIYQDSDREILTFSPQAETIGPANDRRGRFAFGIFPPHFRR